MADGAGRCNRGACALVLCQGRRSASVCGQASRGGLSASKLGGLQAFAGLQPGGLDLAELAIDPALVGEHDFASFASSLGVKIRNTRRRVYQAKFERDGELVIFNIVANSFLPHQVRNTVGTLISVGLGRMTLEGFHSIMEERKIGLAGHTVPACGLCLMKVGYQKDFKENDNENLQR